MIDHVTVRRGVYRDSVALMLLSRDLQQQAGVASASVAMATPLNIGLLGQQGFAPPAEEPSPNDLLIALRVEDETGLDAALAEVEQRLQGGSRDGAGEGAAARSHVSVKAAARDVHADLALISVPGPHAAHEIAGALEAGANVFCFSDNVAVEAEHALKRFAVDRGLLLMGPDCGTAIVDGVGLGFANVVAAGPVGLVGASGTGLQQVCCLLDAAGVGVSQVIGVGGRDLSDAVGATSTLAALRRLDEDLGTEAIVVLSKPAGPQTAARVKAALDGCRTPVAYVEAGGAGAAGVLATLSDAAAWAARAVGAEPYAEPPATLAPRPGRKVVGLYTGGTLCTEAAGVVHAGAPGARAELTDFGDDRWTVGRAHPMIDPALRNAALARALTDPDVGVVLLDVVLGRGAHADPAAEVAAALAELPAPRTDAHAIAVLCGTGGDPQGLDRQAATLRAAGVTCLRDNAAAAALAAATVTA